MNKTNIKQFSDYVNVFQDRLLPEECKLAGYSALINIYDLEVLLPFRLAAISRHHKQYENEFWKIYTLRHTPSEKLESHLTFALKYEGINLMILNALFKKIKPEELETWIASEPMGIYSRRIWFIYEWLTGSLLKLPDSVSGNLINIIDPKQQYVGTSFVSRRHRVRNNLTGTKDFCPLIWRTKKLDKFIEMSLDELVKKTTGKVHPDILTRAAAFLLLKDSRASFAIEGEIAPKNREQKWGRAIEQAGLYQLSQDELIRIQKIVIEDRRFIKMGYRQEGGFVGAHERITGYPLPDHISAKWQDLDKLIIGMVEAYKVMQSGPLDPVLLATIVAFGFVLIHPFEDGNGRIHRYLIHHVLSQKGFCPKGIIFPISAVILKRIDDYRKVLESYSKPCLEMIKWCPTERGNVEVLNETIDLYRYFDATKFAEFLYECVFETIEEVLPEEIGYLERYDEFKTAINERFDMPNQLIELLIRFLQQNEGKLSKRAKEEEFKLLSEDEVIELEKLFKTIFEDFE